MGGKGRNNAESVVETGCARVLKFLGVFNTLNNRRTEEK